TEFASIRNGLTRVLGSGDERPSRLAATATVRDIGHRVAARTTPAFRRALPTLELVLRLFAEILGLAFGLIGLALTFQPLVAGSVAGRLLHFALGALYVVLGSVGGCHVPPFVAYCAALPGSSSSARDRRSWAVARCSAALRRSCSAATPSRRVRAARSSAAAA